MTIDRAFDGLHPDMHAIEFADDTRTWFAGNDGGIWRIAPGFTDDSASCRSLVHPQRGRQRAGTAAQRCERRLKRIPRDIVSLNAGLDTLQYQGLGLDRSAATLSTIIGGTQDNGSHVFSGGRWEARIDGDGGQAAIGAGDPALVWHTYTGAQLDVSLAGGATPSWTYVGQALDASAGERLVLHAAAERSRRSQDRVSPGSSASGARRRRAAPPARPPPTRAATATSSAPRNSRRGSSAATGGRSARRSSPDPSSAPTSASPATTSSPGSTSRPTTSIPPTSRRAPDASSAP